MVTLSTTDTFHDKSFFNSNNAVASTRNRRNQLETRYQEIFGDISKIQHPDIKIMAHLLRDAEKQPDASVRHNIYTGPSSLLDRWKWMAGVENSHDKEIQENYNSCLRFLENSQASSIIQLKNQMMSFWHLDRQIKDYKLFKLEAQTTSSKISQIFFACLEFVFKLFYNPSVLNTGKKLEDRSRETFAKIGGFNLNNIDYDVVAFHILSDENSGNLGATFQDDTHRKFNSVSFGKTYVGIVEKEKPRSVQSLGHYGANPNFQVLIGRDLIEKRPLEPISSEEFIGHVKNAVFSSKRHLIVGNGLEYRGSTQDDQGSDRLLDQKLTQIMVEVAMQNKEIISMKVDSARDELPVLTAGGFKSFAANEINKELNQFRSKEGNKLFPPYRDYSSHSTSLKMEDIAKQNVSYSKGAPEAWPDVIVRERILNPNAAILPEFWARKPNIVEG